MPNPTHKTVLMMPIHRRGVFAMSLLSSILGWFGQSKAAVPRFANISEFRELVIAALQKRKDVSRVAADPNDPAKIQVEIGRSSVTADVSNVFQYLNAYPMEDAQALINRFTRSIVDGKAKSSDDNIVAVVRTRRYIDLAKKSGIEILYEPFSADLVIAYMIDAPDSLSPLPPSSIKGRSIADVRKVALRNVRAWLPKVKADRGLYVIEGNEMLSSSLILINEFWKSIEGQFPADILVVLARRDQLFLFDASNPRTAVLARQLIEVTTKEQVNLLSEKLYLRRGGKILVAD
ncbi:conserved hypothetical protein [Hyphomicrobiales bacterium]|nr:conserved hypothetical protein [Hyphomicrobiales bacterium]CAH1667461.1 conserved hypothetical protein [Hyphomicrobiales bacterium]